MCHYNIKIFYRKTNYQKKSITYLGEKNRPDIKIEFGWIITRLIIIEQNRYLLQLIWYMLNHKEVGS